MEIIETPQEKNCFSNPTNQENQPVKQKCTKRYVQPPRVTSFAPRTTYCPPKNQLDTTTTYHKSYYNENLISERPTLILPVHSLSLPDDKFADCTTNKLSFKPVWGIHKSKAYSPRSRLCLQKGPMEKVTTVRRDYAPKIAPKLEPIKPCGNIRTSKGAFEGATTTVLSYMNPGPIEPVFNYKPQMKYCQPKEPAANETTQKLSYLPYQVCRKENYPWAMKPVYRPPEVSMPVDTTYKKSYLENKAKREQPVLPCDAGVFPRGAEFLKNTIYKESYLPCQTDPVVPIRPCGNITLSEKKMLCDTTNKLSYLPLKGEKRKPIVPRVRKIICENNCGKAITTNQLSFTPKIARRPEMVLPCNNIRTADLPIEDKTTTALSYMKPDHIEQMPNYKPKLSYCKPEGKVDSVTVNQLSYQQWELGPKMDMPWARKPQYCRPQDKMATSTVCHMSFPAPGYYIDECTEEPVDEGSCPCDNTDSADH